MLSQETLESYRQMAPSQRLGLVLKMMREATPYLLIGSPDQVARRFERLPQQNDLRNKRMFEGIARSRMHHDDAG